MEKREEKELWALLHSLLVLSAGEQDRERLGEQTRFIDNLCSGYATLPKVDQILEADPLEVFPEMEDAVKREEFTDILLMYVKGRGTGIEMEREKWLYLSRLLVCLNG